MTRLLVNTFLSFLAGWFGLLDRCLIVAANMPISGQILVLLVSQAAIFAFVLLLANGAFPGVVAAASSRASARAKIFVFGVPLILFIFSPAMISDSMYRARYGNLNKFVVDAHVEHDLTCCLNPLSILKP